MLAPHSPLPLNHTQKWLKRELIAPRLSHQKETGTIRFPTSPKTMNDLDSRGGERPSAPATYPTSLLGPAPAGTETNAFPHDTYGEMQSAKRPVSKEKNPSKSNTLFSPRFNELSQPSDSENHNLSLALCFKHVLCQSIPINLVVWGFCPCDRRLRRVGEE